MHRCKLSYYKRICHHSSLCACVLFIFLHDQYAYNVCYIQCEDCEYYMNTMMDGCILDDNVQYMDADSTISYPWPMNETGERCTALQMSGVGMSVCLSVYPSVDNNLSDE